MKGRDAALQWLKGLREHAAVFDDDEGVAAKQMGVRGVGRARPPVALVVGALAGLALVLLPILVNAIDAAGVDPREAAAILFRPLVGALLFNTISLVVAASIATALIGAATAWLVERTDIPGRGVWSVLMAAPLAVPPFISSFAWVSISNRLQDFGGALLVVAFAYYSLVYLPVAATLRGLDPALEETARALGQGPWETFRRVVLPQLRPALLGGVLLVALDVLTEFGAFALLRFRTFTTELYAQYRIGLDGPETSLLALVIIGLCIVLVAAELQIRSVSATRASRRWRCLWSLWRRHWASRSARWPIGCCSTRRPRRRRSRPRFRRWSMRRLTRLSSA